MRNVSSHTRVWRRCRPVAQFKGALDLEKIRVEIWVWKSGSEALWGLVKFREWARFLKKRDKQWESGEGGRDREREKHLLSVLCSCNFLKTAPLLLPAVRSPEWTVVDEQSTDERLRVCNNVPDTASLGSLPWLLVPWNEVLSFSQYFLSLCGTLGENDLSEHRCDICQDGPGGRQLRREHARVQAGGGKHLLCSLMSFQQGTLDQLVQALLHWDSGQKSLTLKTSLWSLLMLMRATVFTLSVWRRLFSFSGNSPFQW
jgi:hypothetical protein